MSVWGYQTEMASALRDYGLSVVEVEGWRRRGSEHFRPVASMDHHTAGARIGNLPSLRILINGRTGLPGPLCNCAQARDNRIFVIAAGRANHAGRGSYRGLSGNSKFFGLEREHVGTASEAWRADSHETAARVHAALLDVAGQADSSMCVRHATYAPDRKVDTFGVSDAELHALIERTRQEMEGDVDQETRAAIFQTRDWLRLLIEGAPEYGVPDWAETRLQITGMKDGAVQRIETGVRHMNNVRTRELQRNVRTIGVHGHDMELTEGPEAGMADLAPRDEEPGS